MQGMVDRGRVSFLLPTPAGEAVVTPRRNARRLTMRIEQGTGRVRISAPLHVTDAELLDFVAAHTEWLLEHQSRQRLRGPELLRTGGRARLWGVWRELVVVNGTRARADLREERIHITRPAGDEQAARRALGAFYRREVAAAVPPLLQEWVPRFGQGPESIQYRDMSSRWGSCTRSTRRMSLNTRLALLEPEALEYVLLHEMVHLRHSNHGPGFKAALTSLLPNWRERERLLIMHS